MKFLLRARFRPLSCLLSAASTTSSFSYVASFPLRRQQRTLSTLKELYEQYREPYSFHRQLVPFNGREPVVGPESFVAPDATLIGDVRTGMRANIWYHAILRGDLNSIRVGNYTNVQDNCVVITTREHGVEMGDYITIGHRAIMKGCVLEDESFVGMGAVVSEGAVLQKHSMIGAGAVVKPGTVIPSGELWIGNPARFFRKMSYAEVEVILKSGRDYYKYCVEHINEFPPFTMVHREAEDIRRQLGLPSLSAMALKNV